jgi:hypothetical protein
MDFAPIAVDLNPDLSNPLVAIALGICCALLATMLVIVARSDRPRPRKARALVITIAIGSLVSKVLPQTVNGLVVWVHFHRLGQHPSIGVIGESPSFWLAPAVAILLAVAFS